MTLEYRLDFEFLETYGSIPLSIYKIKGTDEFYYLIKSKDTYVFRRVRQETLIEKMREKHHSSK